MFYDPIKIKPLGETGVTIEYGDEAKLILNFKVITLQKAIKNTNLKGIIATIPTMRALGVLFNPLVISQPELICEILKINNQKKEMGKFPSRLLKIPIWYNDSASAECAKKFNVVNNIEFVAKCLNMTVEEVIEIHSGNEYWVTEVGFSPGTYNAYPLDDTKAITGIPKYKVPRTWTPVRTIAVGGRAMGNYPVESPGGYQLIGRSPANFYEPDQLNPTFRDDPILTKPGDRHKYVPINEDEYYKIREKVKNGSYSHEIKEEEFDIKGYLDKIQKRRNLE